MTDLICLAIQRSWQDAETCSVLSKSGQLIDKLEKENDALRLTATNVGVGAAQSPMPKRSDGKRVKRKGRRPCRKYVLVDGDVLTASGEIMWSSSCCYPPSVMLSRFREAYEQGRDSRRITALPPPPKPATRRGGKG